MTRLAWNAVGERFFEAGVDRGVLYVDDTGVSWNGLISVSESPSGGEVTQFYLDGTNYLNRVSLEKFEATVEAFTYPDEFAKCDGTASVGNGLFVTQQARKSFGLSYRTQIGNDVDGIGHGYKIHLVYNALAAPTDHANVSIAESIDPENFTWKLVTKPPRFIGYRPTSHFVIESIDTPVSLLDEIETILYGSDDIEPRLPSVDELIELFSTYNLIVLDAGFVTSLEAPAPIYDVETGMVTIPDVYGIVYSIEGVIITSGSTYGPITEATVITAKPALGYDMEEVTKVVDAGRVTDAPVIDVFDGGVV